MGEVILAVDLGATKFVAGLVDESGVALFKRRVTADHAKNAEGLWKQLHRLVSVVQVEAAARELRVVGCGVGCAGPITPNAELVSPLNLPAWRDFPLAERLRQLTGLPVAGDLDTKALALGEGWRGAARDWDNYLAMVVSTGIGGGLVVDGRLLEGNTGNAGHLGHIVVVPGGRLCGCGARGCLEAEASGSAIEAITGQPAAEANQATMENCGRLVGRGLASVMSLLDIDRALVAGSVALGFGGVFFAAAQAELDANCRSLDSGRRPVLRAAGLGKDAPLIGAAAVGWRALGRLRAESD
jgi:glucokinase